MRLQDFKGRTLLKVQTLYDELTCWECTNKILPITEENKKRVVFNDGSHVILCLKHFMQLMEIIEIIPISYIL